MARTLHAQLSEMARDFLILVIDALRRARLEELVAQGRAARDESAASARAAPTARPGREPRRRSRPGSRMSTAELDEAVDRVVALVRQSKEGLRAEAIRELLGVDASRLQRLLQRGLATKRLRATGRARATTYFAARA